MNRLAVVVAVVAIVIGALAGYLWWGVPTQRLQSELRDAQARADRLEAELRELRASHQRLGERLKAETSSLEAAERDLRGQKEMNARLQKLVSQGRK